MALFKHPQPLRSNSSTVAPGSRCYQEAAAGSAAPANTPAQLVQLSESEAVRVFNQHDGGFWLVNANFNHRG
jgi:hypothetical protein